MTRVWTFHLALLTCAVLACSKEQPADPGEKSAKTTKPAKTDDEAEKADDTAKKPTKKKAPAVEPTEPAEPPTEPSKKGVELVSYTNPRFEFTVGAPKWLTAQPDPTNGDGRTWKGKDVEMSAWGMNEVLTLEEQCSKKDGETIHEVKKDSCFSSGIKDGRIFWQRTRLKDGVYYSVRLEYPKAMKAEMDPVVTAVYASWKTG